MKKHNKKEILVFCPVLEYGGIATTTVNIANFLCEWYSVKIFTNSINKHTREKLNNKILVVDIAKKKILNFRILNSLYVFLSLKNYVNKNSTIFSLQDHLTILILNKFFLKKKIILRTSSIILNSKNIYEAKNYKLKYFKILSTYLYRLADHVITYSNENVKTLKKRGIKNTTCIYNFFAKNKALKIQYKKKFNIFFIGRLSEEKDPVFFLKNLLIFKNINIHFVADGHLKNDLKNLSKNKKNIFFHGYVNEPFKKFKGKINLLCITSKFEGTPNVLGEAMSYKIPVLAPKGVGLADLFLKNGKYGFLYNPNDSHSFKNKINFIINNYKISLKKAEYAFNSLDRFSIGKTLGSIKKIIDKI